jgi:hypothetical protein
VSTSRRHRSGPKGIPAEHGLQLTAYTTPGASGLCRLDTVTKTKTVHVVQQSFQASPEGQLFSETLYPMVPESIRDGIYPPHRSSHMGQDGKTMTSNVTCGFFTKLPVRNASSIFA